jgi:hypothetical protein
MTLATAAKNKATVLKPSTLFSTSGTTKLRSASGRPNTSSTALTSALDATAYSL